MHQLLSQLKIQNLSEFKNKPKGGHLFERVLDLGNLSKILPFRLKSG
ncbi:Hypothetical protein [Corynebacterium glutamicum ATCC 13032]|uniref:Uncharacterized protein n=1 Tax=Corynebacterium glutamicum (strain ATCC 13032 / DSM 20300 / JCM 1318 / BCRC 11384 / CCUG 27702 / LMG 3730 / NBRC 12168 / NCIMB 10025 / NRRL B-2784 / 534) TaxID=196627 RepID=Q8NSM5_CORGL|nr:Hypothetical protein [Corynebacterium glutamicum ATCC 13032]